MDKYLLYLQGGCGNRGCEAIVRTTAAMLRKYCKADKNNTYISTTKIEEDIKAKLQSEGVLIKHENCKIEDLPIYKRGIAHIYNSLFKSEDLYSKFTLKPFMSFDFKNSVALSIGGDHYCYEGAQQLLAFHNKYARKKGAVSVLWGCSVEPSFLKNQKTLEDLKSYDLITARESITYNALVENGVKNAILCPDPAFTLPVEQTEYSKNLEGKKLIGLNLSPYAINSPKDKEIGIKSYKNLIKYIIEKTDYDIVFIPHVMKPGNNDIEIMKEFYSLFENSGRVSMVDGSDMSCCELKGIISKCSMFIGARTHATIAAYSTCVPTFVLGYSVKAKGIATDIFGSYKNYVLPCQEIKNENDVVEGFKWMLDNLSDIKVHLDKFMPSYCQKAYLAGERISELLGEIK